MKASFFKPRKSFSFSPHPFDIGNIIGLWHSHDDNHFLLKIYSLDEDRFADFYSYHLQYVLEKKIAKKEDFFKHVWQTVENRVRHFEMQDPFSRQHALHKSNIQKLQAFHRYLDSIDEWNARPSHLLIAEKDSVIRRQLSEIESLKLKLSELTVFEVTQKVWVDEGYLPTLIDLVLQLKELELDSGRKLLKSDHKIPYAKMISRYFSHAGKNISIETLRNYFVNKKGDVPVKGTTVPADRRLFRIVRADQDFGSVV
ncbi:hypothetical protein [Pedobacter sp. Leaf250]|uniref:hypothetical protein n=1 Tax=Pedobacter sp. Leaf250 TaxID=2876559 RepID=UPI001E2C0755|nr:hypothetical protein [Pedobacter sp. Leaf250]